MIVTYRYELTDLGMNFDSIMKMIEDFVEHICKEIPSVTSSDKEIKFVALMHPELIRKMHSETPASFINFGIHAAHTEDIEGADGSFPGILQSYKIANVGIVASIVVEPNELVITSEEFIPLIERFMKTATKEAFAKGERYGYLHSHPESREYDEGYILVNLNDEESMERFKDRMKWKVK